MLINMGGSWNGVTQKMDKNGWFIREDPIEMI